MRKISRIQHIKRMNLFSIFRIYFNFINEFFIYESSIFNSHKSKQSDLWVLQCRHAFFTQDRKKKGKNKQSVFKNKKSSSIRSFVFFVQLVNEVRYSWNKIYTLESSCEPLTSENSFFSIENKIYKSEVFCLKFIFKGYALYEKKLI